MTTQTRARGFTLIELMIVVMIIAVLAGIALTSYRNSVQSSRRAAAQACMMQMTQFMERFYTTNLAYTGGDPTAQGFSCQQELSVFYTFALPAAATATAFSISATPQGAQERDTKCGTLGVNQAGTKTASGTDGIACW